jgi:hypothetical protein
LKKVRNKLISKELSDVRCTGEPVRPWKKGDSLKARWNARRFERWGSAMKEKNFLREVTRQFSQE